MAVVISFLVVLLAMYTTIIERTREIGILRAIGASQATVVRLVVSESFLICLAGVVVGHRARRGRPLATCRCVFPTLAVPLTPGMGADRGRPGPRRAGCSGRSTRRCKAARMDPIQALNFE